MFPLVIGLDDGLHGPLLQLGCQPVRLLRPKFQCHDHVSLVHEFEFEISLKLAEPGIASSTVDTMGIIAGEAEETHGRVEISWHDAPVEGVLALQPCDDIVCGQFPVYVLRGTG